MAASRGAHLRTPNIEGMVSYLSGYPGAVDFSILLSLIDACKWHHSKEPGFLSGRDNL